MSTSEKWTNDYSPCPCGNGKILEHVESPDNPWSRMSRYYSLDCEVCSSEYVLIGTELRHKQAYEDARNSWNNKCRVENDLKELCKAAIDEIIIGMCISHKEEYKLLKSVGLCSEGPIRYPRLRGAGKKPSELCEVLENINWINNMLSDSTRVKNISKLKKEMDRYDKDWRNASKEEKPISITSLKT
jgi:hypothetical protein